MIDQLLNIESQVNKFINLLEFNKNNKYIHENLLMENSNNLIKEFSLLVKDIDKTIDEIEIFFNKNRNEVFDFDQDKSIGYCHKLREKIEMIEFDYKNFNTLNQTDKVDFLSNILLKVKNIRKNFNSYYRSALGIQSNNKKIFIEIESIKKTIEKNIKMIYLFLK